MLCTDSRTERDRYGNRGLCGTFTDLYPQKGAFLTVAEEVQILENYIHLQEFRNGEAYQTEYKIEREAEQCKIPRLLLQPLVENAIIHGLDIKKQKKKTSDRSLHIRFQTVSGSKGQRKRNVRRTDRRIT